MSYVLHVSITWRDRTCGDCTFYLDGKKTECPLQEAWAALVFPGNSMYLFTYSVIFSCDGELLSLVSVSILLGEQFGNFISAVIVKI